MLLVSSSELILVFGSIVVLTFEYFKNKAADYDRVDEQVYWRLSDSILWHTFNEYILKNLPSNFSFLDAGGGTGRWSEKY